MANYANIIIDSTAEAVDRPFTYRIPEALAEQIQIGQRVQVPFGNARRSKSGYVIGLTEAPDYDTAKLKDIEAVLPRALTAEADMIELAVFMAKTYGSTLNQALKTALPVKRQVGKNSRRKDPVAVIEAFGSANVPADVAASGATSSAALGASALNDVPGIEKLPALNEEQQRVYDALIAEMKPLYAQRNNAQPNHLQSGNMLLEPTPLPKPSLLYGITGSGKTLLYLRLIAYALRCGREAIVLIPEISLTYQTVRALSSAFGSAVAVLHSRLSAGERYEQYQKAAKGELRVMVGPRSAIFAPFSKLGLIIIDEEHERSYQSDTSPRYDVREVAAQRARLSGAKLLLGSATPSLKSYTLALAGRYSLFRLTRRAVPGAALPKVHVVDLREELAAGNRSIFSKKLMELMEERLEKHEQMMLFINRRGYAGFVSCRSCGHVMKCPHCDVSLTAHNDWYFDRRTGKREAALLSCHYCGYEAPYPKRCPSCGSPYIAPFGTGTQKLEQAVRRAFPKARVLRMDADSTARKYAHEKMLAAFQKGEADILIGTQMIVKGHDFPLVTLVGIVAADLSLNTPEYDASERSFQLLTQAAGRAGRGSRAGDVVIQSYDPSHYAIACAAAQDFETFYKREMSYRRLMQYPPCVSMLAIRFQSPDEELLAQAAEAATAAIRAEAQQVSAQLIGPCRASLYKLNDQYRKILYIKHEEHAIIFKLREALRSFLAEQYRGRAIYLSFDLK